MISNEFYKYKYLGLDFYIQENENNFVVYYPLNEDIIFGLGWESNKFKKVFDYTLDSFSSDLRNVCIKAAVATLIVSSTFFSPQLQAAANNDLNIATDNGIQIETEYTPSELKEQIEKHKWNTQKVEISKEDIKEVVGFPNIENDILNNPQKIITKDIEIEELKKEFPNLKYTPITISIPEDEHSKIIKKSILTAINNSQKDILKEMKIQQQLGSITLEEFENIKKFYEEVLPINVAFSKDTFYGQINIKNLGIEIGLPFGRNQNYLVANDLKNLEAIVGNIILHENGHAGAISFNPNINQFGKENYENNSYVFSEDFAINFQRKYGKNTSLEKDSFVIDAINKVAYTPIIDKDIAYTNIDSIFKNLMSENYQPYFSNLIDEKITNDEYQKIYDTYIKIFENEKNKFNIEIGEKHKSELLSNNRGDSFNNNIFEYIDFELNNEDLSSKLYTAFQKENREKSFTPYSSLDVILTSKLNNSFPKIEEIQQQQLLDAGIVEKTYKDMYTVCRVRWTYEVINNLISNPDISKKSKEKYLKFFENFVTEKVIKDFQEELNKQSTNPFNGNFLSSNDLVESIQSNPLPLGSILPIFESSKSLDEFKMLAKELEDGFNQYNPHSLRSV